MWSSIIRLVLCVLFGNARFLICVAYDHMLWCRILENSKHCRFHLVWFFLIHLAHLWMGYHFIKEGWLRRERRYKRMVYFPDCYPRFVHHTFCYSPLPIALYLLLLMLLTTIIRGRSAQKRINWWSYWISNKNTIWLKCSQKRLRNLHVWVWQRFINHSPEM